MTTVEVHRRTKSSANVSRKNMRRPEKAPRISRFAETTVEQVPVQVVRAQEVEPLAQVDYSNLTIDMVKVNRKMQARAAERVEGQAQPQVKLSAKEIKEQEIKKAIAATNRSFAKQKKSRRHYKKMDFGFRRVMFAMAASAVAVFAIVYFVNTNTPDVSLQVAAMQTGIDARYPGYIPRGYSLSDITSESGKITLNFRNSTSGGAFSLVEEETDWDTSDLYTEFVLKNYGDSYTLLNDSGTTVYVSGNSAAWVKDGIFYKLTTTAGSLTKKQISTIATNL